MSATPRRPLFVGPACLAILLGAAAVPGSRAAEHQPEARKLLDEVARAYKDLPAYADRGEFVIAMKVDGRAERQAVPLHVTFVRPNKLDLEAGPVRVVSDGKTITTVAGPLKRYTTGPAPAAVSLETFREGPAGSMLFGGPTAPVTFILANLLVGEDPAKAILAELGGVLKSEPDRELDGKKCRILLVDRESGTDLRLFVDPVTKLVRGIDMVLDAKQLSETLGQKIAVDRFGWDSRGISTEEMPKPKAFAYTPPKSFAKVESFAKAAAAGEAGEPKYRVLELLGKPAPDFRLTVLDEGGKFKAVTKADLAGKVVVIDFWATWCGPCLRELPEVQKMIEGYAKAKKEVVIVALSQDERPSELGEVRKLVESTLKRQSINLTGSPVGKIAVDPSGSIGEAFQVEGFPTVVTLDAKGTVQSAHVGFTPDIREVLGKDIDALLAGKSLVTRKAGQAEGGGAKP